ncbi:MAG TPA: hypothetical protein VJH95_03570, partial [Candidatus Nanoarchaeia archaeon]|nr:hypothetical protein [Candidatus Nanoarchaeia archaeon]
MQKKGFFVLLFVFLLLVIGFSISGCSGYFNDIVGEEVEVTGTTIVEPRLMTEPALVDEGGEKEEGVFTLFVNDKLFIRNVRFLLEEVTPDGGAVVAVRDTQTGKEEVKTIKPGETSVFSEFAVTNENYYYDGDNPKQSYASLIIVPVIEPGSENENLLIDISNQHTWWQFFMKKGDKKEVYGAAIELVDFSSDEGIAKLSIDGVEYILKQGGVVDLGDVIIRLDSYSPSEAYIVVRMKSPLIRVFDALDMKYDYYNGGAVVAVRDTQTGKEEMKTIKPGETSVFSEFAVTNENYYYDGDNPKQSYASLIIVPVI